MEFFKTFLSSCAECWQVNANKLSWITQSKLLTKKIKRVSASFFLLLFLFCKLFYLQFCVSGDQWKIKKKNCTKDFTVNFLKIISYHIPHSQFALLIFRTTFLLARISFCNFFFLNHLENFWEGMAHMSTCLDIKIFFNVISRFYGMW